MDRETRSGGRAVVLVEGVSDQRALEALARRQGRSLDDERVTILAMGGASHLGRYLQLLLPRPGVRLTGLFDAGEERHVRRQLERAGLGTEMSATPGRSGMEALGYYLCVEDLEDELIRALGSAAVVRIVERQGELGSFHTYQKQGPHHGLPLGAQLHGFMGNRKVRYAPLLVDALDLDRVPRPLACVLEHVASADRTVP